MAGFLILLFIFFAFQMQAQTAVPREYQVKAVFLYNFTQFVEWPAAVFTGPSEPFIIGILGNDPFGLYLDQTLTGENKMGHPMIVQRFKDVKDISNCHILFISQPEQESEALAVTKSRSILTVSDISDFLSQGGMVRFFNKDNRIRFQINPTAAKTGNLIISSKLLRLADIYD